MEFLLKFLEVFCMLAKEIIDMLSENIKKIESQIEINYNIIKDSEAEIMDLEHEIELTKFNAAEGCILAKRIQKARQARRKAKDENYILLDLKQLMDENLKIKIYKTKTNIDKKVKELKDRVYKPRILQDLKIANTHSDIMQGVGEKYTQADIGKYNIEESFAKLGNKVVKKI